MMLLALHLSLLVTNGDPCAHTLDRTEQCSSPAAIESGIASDDKPAPDVPMRDPLAIPRQVGLIAFGTAALGAGALAWTEVRGGNAALSGDERSWLRIGGASCLAASGAMLAASTALAVFDPSTGKLRFSFEDGD